MSIAAFAIASNSSSAMTSEVGFCAWTLRAAAPCLQELTALTFPCSFAEATAFGTLENMKYRSGVCRACNHVFGDIAVYDSHEEVLEVHEEGEKIQRVNGSRIVNLER